MDPRKGDRIVVASETVDAPEAALDVEVAKVAAAEVVDAPEAVAAMDAAKLADVDVVAAPEAVAAPAAAPSPVFSSVSPVLVDGCIHPMPDPRAAPPTMVFPRTESKVLVKLEEYGTDGPVLVPM